MEQTVHLTNLPKPGSAVLTLAQEIAGSGVTANVIRIKTIDVKHERDRDPKPTNKDWTSPEEIASTIDYLCSEGAQMINGARIPLYGRP